MEALDILFADDVVSAEAVAMPGAQQEIKGLAGCEGEARVVARKSRDSFRLGDGPLAPWGPVCRRIPIRRDEQAFRKENEDGRGRPIYGP
jgi:hypothetical protein